jgi:two-component system phosphate regulon sensor histidine kinase PhoR
METVSGRMSAASSVPHAAATAGAAIVMAGFVAGGLMDPWASLVLLGLLVAGYLWDWSVRRLAGSTKTARIAEESFSSVPLTVFDALPDPVILVGKGREVQAANLSARELLDPKMVGADLAMSLRHPEVLSCVDAVLNGQPVKRSQISLPVPVRRSFEVNAIGLPGTTEGAPRAVLVLHDMTIATHAQQMRADFIANASHELRSPLAALVGFIETLKGPARDDPAARDHFLDIMQREAERMSRLIGDLLSLSRVEVNEHVQPRDPVDLGIVLETVGEVLSGQARARNMEIRVTVPDGLPPVAGDADQLSQVFQNLVDNAVKYGREGSVVEIEVTEVERIPESGVRGVAVAVRDQGEGIPAEHIPRLTERFYRIDKARSRSVGGTGLGLAIVKHIVNRHRGRIKVESEVGRGSVFTVYLRAAQRAGAA